MRKQREHNKCGFRCVVQFVTSIYLFIRCSWMCCCCCCCWRECKQVFVVSSHVGFKFKMCIQKMHRNASPRIAWWQDLRESPFRLVFLWYFQYKKLAYTSWRAYNYKMCIVFFFIFIFHSLGVLFGSVRFIVSFCAWHAFSASARFHNAAILELQHECTNAHKHKQP